MPPGGLCGWNIEVVIGNMQAVIRCTSLKVLVGFSLPFIYKPVDNM